MPNFAFIDKKFVTKQDVENLTNELLNSTWVIQGNPFKLKSAWEIKWTDHTSHIAACSCEHHGSELRNGKINFSLPYFKNNYDKVSQIEDTIRHEVAHAIDLEYRGHSGHDTFWKDLASIVGAIPARTCNDMRPPLAPYYSICMKCGNMSARKTKKGRACKFCCDKHNGGTYSTDFELAVVSKASAKEILKKLGESRFDKMFVDDAKYSEICVDVR